ncbi:MAG: Spi family protease inhibitor [Bacteroides sp.]|nr:Spi family protease inhibitor [Bacteroides sp.]
MVDGLDGPGTRSGRRTIKKIEGVSNFATRSGDDLGLFVISYKDNRGFAIVSTKNSELPVIGFSNEGNVSADDVYSNPSLGLF